MATPPRLAVIVVRKRRGRVNHATSQGVDSYGETYCGKPCDGWTLPSEPGGRTPRVTCKRCLERVTPC